MMERNMVQKHKKKTTKVSKPKIAKAPTEEVEDRAKGNEERVAAVNNNIEEIEAVDMTSIEKQRKVTPTEKECKLTLGDISHIVAIANVMTGDDPSTICHGTPLGDENLRVFVYATIEEQTMIPFAIKDELMTMKQAMGSWVMWPKNLIIYDEKKKVSGKASRKQKRNQFSPYSDAELDLQSLPSSLPVSLKKLCEWGKEGFKDGKTICFYKEEPVFGYHGKSFLLDVDVMRLAHMEKITLSCIVVYLRYLHDVLKQFKTQDMVAFIDPTLTGEIGCGSPSQRSRNIKDRLVLLLQIRFSYCLTMHLLIGC